ncbi:Cof-type HAD-IIB family hydrolase [Psychroflexus tropicus]|uniref:Cof-type HAD-IIB family hydrolase n=1 Tax=Psychroflexus tropicus TaxID=197345 RepID=UPI000475C17C|nr:Cof-type HAD-IIB family hydrolase [Psychroflexus tropicus]
MINLICSDIDGTLLNANRELSPLTISSFKSLNLPAVLISSRMPSAMHHLQKQLDLERQPIVAYNGGLVLTGNETKLSTTISYELVKDICLLNIKGLHLSMYRNDEWYAPQDDKWTQREANNTKVNPTLMSNNKVVELWGNQKAGAHKIMCMGKAQLIDEFFNQLNTHYGDELHLYRSKDTYIEIAPKSISKRSAIEFLLETEFNTDLSKVMSFGDNYNDIEMLAGCGMGLAVGNAKAEVKLAANRVIENAKDDGVAKFLIQYFKLG